MLAGLQLPIPLLATLQPTVTGHQTAMSVGAAAAGQLRFVLGRLDAAQ